MKYKKLNTLIEISNSLESGATVFAYDRYVGWVDVTGSETINLDYEEYREIL